MGKKHRRLIPADGIKNEQALDTLLGELMGFPGWNGQRIDEWIDMVTIGSSAPNAIPHFRTVEEDNFQIEINNSSALIGRPPLMIRLIHQIATVNRRSQERVGRPLLTLVLS